MFSLLKYYSMFVLFIWENTSTNEWRSVRFTITIFVIYWPKYFSLREEDVEDRSKLRKNKLVLTFWGKNNGLHARWLQPRKQLTTISDFFRWMINSSGYFFRLPCSVWVLCETMQKITNRSRDIRSFFKFFPKLVKLKPFRCEAVFTACIGLYVRTKSLNLLAYKFYHDFKSKYSLKKTISANVQYCYKHTHCYATSW